MQKTDANTTDEKRTRWKALSEAASAEKKWTNERLAWLFTPQGVLFAALGITLTNNADDSLITLRHNLRLGIAFVGVAITIVVFLRVLAAARMHREWTREMEEIAKDIPDQVTFGNPPHWPSRLARRASLAMPLIFLAAWGYLLITCWCMPVR